MPFYAARTARLAVAGLTALALLTGCSGNEPLATPRTIEPGRAADSPATVVTPAGQIRPMQGTAQSAIFDPGTRSLVVLAGGPTPALRLFGEQPEARTVALPGGDASVTALAGDGPGRALLAARGGYFTVDLTAGSATRVDVQGRPDAEFTAIVRRADGALVLGAADGTVVVLDGPSAVAHSSKIFARVDMLAVHDDTVLVLDRGQTLVTELKSDGGQDQALRAGEGATMMVADPVGRVLVTDSRGNELLAFGVDPLIMRQRYPVHSVPYGLAGSATLTWVSTTANNQIVGYDLSTGIPVEKVRHPSVRQPDLLAYDDGTDTLYAVSTRGDGVQVIPNASGRQ